MRKKFLLLPFLLACFGGAQRAQAQAAPLGTAPYTQNFDALAAQNYGSTAGTVHCTANHLDSPTEVYLQATFPGTNLTNYSPETIGANDGSNSTAAYYHFGYTGSSDRAFGGIAGTSYVADGIGYVGIRLKNNTGVNIVNLEVQYAMEQWYNSGRQDQAKVSVSYQTGSSVISLLTGTWKDVAALGVDAPSTATAITSRDGNSPANRRVASTTIMGLNLAPNQEIMLRWGYALSSATNGNGLSIDDVVITPETNIFYSKTANNLTLNSLATWGQNTDGTGTAPTSFAADNQIFYVMSPTKATALTAADATNRFNGNWTVSGANSKIIVGTSTVPAIMSVSNMNNRSVVGTIDVSANSYFLHQRSTNPEFTLGTLASTSTVDYSTSGNPLVVQANQYGNLTISGGTTNTDRSKNLKTLGGATIVAGKLTLTEGSNLELLDNDLTVLSSGSVTGGTARAYVVTDGKGRLRLQVPRASSSSVAGTKITFPIGTSVTSYTPVTLQQTSTNSDDVFEARVLDGVSSRYDASYAPTGTAVTSQNVLKTWLISKEVPTNMASVTMSLQWSSTEDSEDFMRASGTTPVHINHYTDGKWDKYLAELTNVSGNGPFVATRSNITSFSPFGVSSRADGTLPVVLTAFAAQRSGAAVRCTWATASELHSRSFSVERSLDGISFETLGEVAAAGLSSTARTYSFLDTRAVATTAYYRLRQNDLDGQVAYSTIVAVAGTAPESVVTAVPNPSTGLVQVSAANIIRLEVLNALGQSVLTQQPDAPAQSLPLDLGAQPAGVYLVRLHTAHGTQVVRVVKN